MIKLVKKIVKHFKDRKKLKKQLKNLSKKDPFIYK
jgi:hypothetical protein